jgi:hypothetical protein
MIYIEGHWETVTSLEDVARIIREYYNRELADEMDKLIEIKENEIRDLQLELYNAPMYDNDDDDWYDD